MSLWQFWLERGFTEESREYFGVFQDGSRLWIPVHSTYGELIGHQGWNPNITSKKYKFSLVKGKSLKLTLFNLNRAKKEIEKRGYAVVVEGTLDCVAPYQSDIPNVVSTFGTSPGLRQWRAPILLRYCSDAIIIFDGDAAGRNAALNTKECIEKIGGRVILGDCSKLGCDDPDEIRQKYGEKGLYRFIHKLKERLNDRPAETD